MFKKPNQHYPESTPPKNPTMEELLEFSYNPKYDKYENFDEWLSDPTGTVELREKIKYDSHNR